MGATSVVAALPSVQILTAVSQSHGALTTVILLAYKHEVGIYLLI